MALSSEDEFSDEDTGSVLQRSEMNQRIATDLDTKFQVGGAVTTRAKARQPNIEQQTVLPNPGTQTRSKKKRKISFVNDDQTITSQSPISPQPSTSTAAVRDSASPQPSTSRAATSAPENEPIPSRSRSPNNLFNQETKVFENEQFSLFIQRQDHIHQKVRSLFKLI